jgi:hypothetical protein
MSTSFYDTFYPSWAVNPNEEQKPRRKRKEDVNDTTHATGSNEDENGGVVDLTKLYHYQDIEMAVIQHANETKK